MELPTNGIPSVSEGGYLVCIQCASSYSNVDTAKASQVMKLFLTITLQLLKNVACFKHSNSNLNNIAVFIAT